MTLTCYYVLSYQAEKGQTFWENAGYFAVLWAMMATGCFAVLIIVDDESLRFSESAHVEG